MFIYVFTEADRDTLTRRGFAFICRDQSANAWVFAYDPRLGVPDGMEAVVSSRLNFIG